MSVATRVCEYRECDEPITGSGKFCCAGHRGAEWRAKQKDDALVFQSHATPRKRFCECEKPIVATDEDARFCFRCTRPLAANGTQSTFSDEIHALASERQHQWSSGCDRAEIARLTRELTERFEVV